MKPKSLKSWHVVLFIFVITTSLYASEWLGTLFLGGEFAGNEDKQSITLNFDVNPDSAYDSEGEYIGFTALKTALILHAPTGTAYIHIQV